MTGYAFIVGSRIHSNCELYLQASFARDQDVIFVSANYRLSAFGFPSSDDPNEIELQYHNLGLFDQELALEWTRLNVAAFGGDPHQITLMGHSAGATSVSWMLSRHAVSPPFRAAILLSSPLLAEAVPVPDGAAWNALATAVGCTGPSGKSRLDCLKSVPASALQDFVNGPSGPASVSAVIDK
jgi:carboxylesterase type B